MLPEETLVLDRPNEADGQDEELLGYTHLEQPQSNRAFRDVADFFREIQYLHILPQLMRDPGSFLKGDRKEDYYGRDFLEKISRTPTQTRDSYLLRIEKALKVALPHLEGLRFEKDEMGVPHFKAYFKHWRGTAAHQVENQFSDGTLRFIGLFWALQDGTKPILLEEPELSLHSAIVRQLPQIIYQLQKKKSVRRQVILTTHSHELLSDKGIAGEEVLLLIPDHEGTQVLPAALINDVKLMLDSGSSIGDAIVPRTRPRNIEQLTLFKL